MCSLVPQIWCTILSLSGSLIIMSKSARDSSAIYIEVGLNCGAFFW